MDFEIQAHRGKKIYQFRVWFATWELKHVLIILNTLIFKGLGMKYNQITLYNIDIGLLQQ